MIDAMEIVERLKYLRALAEASNKLFIQNREGELVLSYVNDFVKAFTSVDNQKEDNFAICIQFKELYEVLNNSISDFIEMYFKDGELHIKLRNGEAIFETQNLLFKPDDIPDLTAESRCFSMEVKRFKDILQSLIKLNTDCSPLIINVNGDTVEFGLSSGNFTLKEHTEINTDATIAIKPEAMEMIYKTIRNMTGAVDVYTNGEDVSFLTESVEITADNINEVYSGIPPDTSYHFNLVKDDILEAFEIASNISKTVDLTFEQNYMTISSDNVSSAYRNKVLVESTVPDNTVIKVDAKRMLTAIKTVDDDYIDFELTKTFEEIVIENNNKLMIIGVM